MPPRKPLDIDSDLAALHARADKLKTDHKLRLGQIVLETGVHKALDADQIRDALIRARDQAKTMLPQEEGPAEPGGTFPAAADAPSKPDGRTEPKPARDRPADLLDGAAPHRAGHRPDAEGAGDGIAA